jgi:hypothetical protein
MFFVFLLGLALLNLFVYINFPGILSSLLGHFVAVGHFLSLHLLHLLLLLSQTDGGEGNTDSLNHG